MTINITVITGNGLDLTNGLKTSYTEFFENYVSSIRRPKNKIYNFLKTDKKLWNDVERSIGHLDDMGYKSLSDFINDKERLQNDLGEYLSSIDKKVIADSPDKRRINLLSFINHIDENLLPSDKKILESFLEDRRLSGKDNNELNRIPGVASHFLTFNYTHLLEKKIGYFRDSYSKETIGDFRLLSGYRVLPASGKIIHTHGSIEDSFIFGVNDSSQITNNVQALEGADRYLVKSSLQKMAKSENQSESTRIIATESDIIVIIGLSLGDTDKYWCEMIMASLIYNPDLIVIVNKFEKNNHSLHSPVEIEKIIQGVKSNFLNTLINNPTLMGYLNESHQVPKNLMSRILVAPYTDITSNIGNLKFNLN